MKPFCIEVRYFTKPGCRESFIKEIKENRIAGKVLTENGAIRYEYFLSAEENDMVLLMEEWESREAQQAHMNHPNMETIVAIKEKYVASTELKIQE